MLLPSCDNFILILFFTVLICHVYGLASHGLRHDSCHSPRRNPASVHHHLWRLHCRLCEPSRNPRLDGLLPRQQLYQFYLQQPLQCNLLRNERQYGYNVCPGLFLRDCQQHVLQCRHPRLFLFDERLPEQRRVHLAGRHPGFHLHWTRSGRVRTRHHPDCALPGCLQASGEEDPSGVLRCHYEAGGRLVRRQCDGRAGQQTDGVSQHIRSIPYSCCFIPRGL